MEDLREWLTDLWRPWQTSCLPEELALPNERVSVLDANKMLRDARMGATCDLELGVFQILGVDEAHRAAPIWWPPTRLITEEVAIAFGLVEKQRQSGEIVSGHNVTRLVETLHAYFLSVGRPRSRDEISRQIDAFLGEHSLPDAEGMSPVRQAITVQLPLLDKLRAVETEVSAQFTDRHGRPESLDAVGLILDAHLDDHRYDHCTPLNCRTFAGTGGDGAHFSLLVQEGAITESSPVVVTAPDAFGMPSVAVAESLFDFLCLGCRKGYFGLGYVPHAPEQTLKEYVGPDGELPVTDYIIDDHQHDVMTCVRDRLGLKPWTDWRRFQATHSRYGPLLRYPPDAIFG